MRRFALLLAGAAALATAIPASASHHPRAAQLVTMTVTRQNAQLTFSYTVTQQPCRRPHCGVNFGKPYRILIFVYSGVLNGLTAPSPLLLSAPPHCNATGLALIDCNAPGRDESNPAAALPMAAVIKVRAGTLQGATATIVADGYSLNTMQENIPVPPHDCSGLETSKSIGEKIVTDDEETLRKRFAALSKIENAALLRFRVGELYYHLRERAIDNVVDAEASVREALDHLNEIREAYAACIQTPTAAMRLVPATRATTCSEAEWSSLLDRVRALKFKNIQPLVRKIAKAKKPAVRRRYMRKLRALIRPEVRKVKAVRKSIDVCF